MVRVVDGTLKKGDKIRFLATGTDYEVTELGRSSRPSPTAIEELGPGEVGFVAANIKSVHDVKLGDTVTHAVSAPGKGPHHMGPATEAAPRLQGRQAHGLRRASTRPTAPTTRSSATRWRSCT